MSKKKKKPNPAPPPVPQHRQSVDEVAAFVRGLVMRIADAERRISELESRPRRWNLFFWR